MYSRRAQRAISKAGDHFTLDIKPNPNIYTSLFYCTEQQKGRLFHDDTGDEPKTSQADVHEKPRRPNLMFDKGNKNVQQSTNKSLHDKNGIIIESSMIEAVIIADKEERPEMKKGMGE